MNAPGIRTLFLCCLFALSFVARAEEGEEAPAQVPAPPAAEDTLAPENLYEGPPISGKKIEGVDASGNAQDMKVRVLRHVIERMRRIEERLKASDKLIAELNDRTKLLLLHQPVKPENVFYIRGNLSLIFPRRSTFSISTDTGIGMHVGFGRYFGTKHVIDVGFDWDFYPAVSMQYRYLFHIKVPSIFIGPMLGIKMKIASGPLDNFITDPTVPKSTYYMAGLHVGFPVINAVITGDAMAIFNSQFSIAFMAGLQFML